jgi:CRISPR/Cas system-associated exonuclease Cas4 (RecB family)
MPNEIYISASLIKDWLDCPRKVSYRLNSPEMSIQTPEMFLGTIVHETLEKHWDDKTHALEWVDYKTEKLKLDEKLRAKGRSCVINYFTHFANLTSDEDKIEYKFKIPFRDSFLVGKMDRITKSGCIIDWKTSVRRTSNISGDPQFILYSYVYEKVFGRQPSGAMKIHLPNNEIATYVRNPILEYNMINDIIPTIIESIKSGLLAPSGLFSGKCYRCSCSEACKSDLGE